MRGSIGRTGREAATGEWKRKTPRVVVADRARFGYRERNPGVETLYFGRNVIRPYRNSAEWSVRPISTSVVAFFLPSFCAVQGVATATESVEELAAFKRVESLARSLRLSSFSASSFSAASLRGATLRTLRSYAVPTRSAASRV